MTKTGRNDVCPCGSGQKFKKCCESKDRTSRSRLMMLVVGGAVVAAIIVGIASFTDESSPTRLWSAEHGHYHDASWTAVP